MYARLCAASSASSVCLVCRHLSRLRRSLPSGERRHVAQAALAPCPPQSTSVELGSSDQGSSARVPTSRSQKSSKSTPRSAKPNSSTEAARTKPKASKPARNALKEAEEAERRRKALAVLGKTSNFDAAIKDTRPHEPTLLDLEQLRPKDPPLIKLEYIYPECSTRLHHGSPSDASIERYRAAFKEIVDTLTQKFTKKQLLAMYNEGKRQWSGVQLGSPRPITALKRRQDVAGEIVRWLWQWPYVTEVMQRKIYLTERSERVFPIGTREFFLLLGRDGSALLSLTKSFKVVIKQVVRTADAFSLVIEGPSYLLDRLGVVLAERKTAILSQVVSVRDPAAHGSTPQTNTSSISPDLLQRISKLSEALVEDKGSGTFQISAHHSRNIELATRLTARASQQAALPPPSLLAHLPTMRDNIPGVMFPHTYALFPLELPKATALPWNWISTSALPPSSSAYSRDASESSANTMHSTGNPSIFRARKVSDWLGQDLAGDASHLRDDLGRILGTSGQLHTLRDVLGLNDLQFPGATSDVSWRRKITASTGYIVFAGDMELRNTLVPPLPGSWIFPSLLDWMRGNKGKIAFIPNPPICLVQHSPSEKSVMNQLVYRSPVPETYATSTPSAATHTAVRSRTLKIDISINPQNPVEQPLITVENNQEIGHRPHTTNENPLYDNHTKDALVPASRLQILSGVESFVNIMLPDRPIDMQLALFDSVPVPRESEPSEIQSYASALIRCTNVSDGMSRPDPPLHLTYQGTRYVLDSNVTIQRSSQNVVHIGSEIQMEHVLDLESDQQTITCQATCTETNITSAWKKFLGHCDGLTLLTGSEEKISPMISER